MDKNIKFEFYSKNLHLFKYKTEGKVRFDEVDSFGVVHNLSYFYWLEWARTNYFNDTGFPMKSDSFITELPVMTVHAEADYYKPVLFFENYTTLTRISFIGNSSLGFENVILNSKNEISMIASAVLVNVDKDTSVPVPLPENLRRAVIEREGKDLIIKTSSAQAR